MKPLLVVMGVSGCGKSTAGALLAKELGIPFEDGDDLHSESNIAKMAAGHPLTDEDRWPWLRRVGRELKGAKATGMVMACSALKRRYREAILAAAPRAEFVLLEGSRELLEQRMSQRQGHYMPAALLDSQLATLEPLAADEPGVTVSIDATPGEIVADIRARLTSL